MEIKGKSIAFFLVIYAIFHLIIGPIAFVYPSEGSNIPHLIAIPIWIAGSILIPIIFFGFLSYKGAKIEHRGMKFGIIDIIFLILYLTILIWLIMSYDVTIPMEGGSGGSEDIRWDRVANILLYAIVVPIVYFVIRLLLSKKK